MSSIFALVVAILSEVTATASLKASDGFSRILPSIIVVIGYAASFYFSAVSLKELPLGWTYAIWSAGGTVGAAIIGILLFGEQMNVPKGIGLVLIIAGVITLNIVTPE